MKNKLKELIEQSGFDCVGQFSAADLKLLPEVRDMCAADKCHAYNRSWSCPPACGTLEYFEERFTNYQDGLVFQTIGQMQDSLDFEAVQAASILHKERFHNLVEQTLPYKSDLLLLSAGSCSLCESCTYPDAPCRFPDKVYPSMEATGLLVSDVCTAAGVPYYHGPNTIAYSSCVLF
ncbi:hypothetical protein FACS1894104_1400 [Actinomycetota bacterium]|nr:hypothetical protein FACS1894104_1400 [Actinomycetota bacterium]